MAKTKSEQGQFCWNELMTTDAGKAKEFYSSLFGWEAKDMDMGSEGTYTMWKQADTDIGGMMQISAKEAHIPPHWQAYISVDNLDEMVEKAKKLGAKILMTQNVGDFGRFALMQDPTGAHISLWQSLKEC